MRCVARKERPEYEWEFVDAGEATIAAGWTSGRSYDPLKAPNQAAYHKLCARPIAFGQLCMVTC